MFLCEKLDRPVVNDRARLCSWSPRTGFAGRAVRGEGIAFLSSTIAHGHLLRFDFVHGRFWILLAALVVASQGCGTTRMSDTLRTGTEQILISAAIDRSINGMNFDELKGKDVYFDPQYLKGVSDEGYLVSSIRQRLLAEGVFLKAARDEATYVVEARAGAVGTNRQDVLIGVPQTSLPTGALTGGGPSVIPEIPLAKKTHQKGVAKIAVFAYNQVTGQALWQSGAVPVTADARDTWVLGTGPFQRGSIYTGTSFTGHRVSMLSKSSNSPPPASQSGTPVNVAQTFVEDPNVVPPSPPESFTKKSNTDNNKSGENGKSGDNKVTPAGFAPGVPPSQPQPGRIPSTAPATSTSPSSTSGFSSNTYNISGAQDATGSSGGNPAASGAAGLLFYKNSTSKTSTP